MIQRPAIHLCPLFIKIFQGRCRDSSHLPLLLKGDNSMPKSVKSLGKNKFKITVSCGYDECGKQLTRSKTITCKNGETQAYEELGKFKKELETEKIIAKNKIQTLANFIDEKWLPDYASLVGNSPATYDNYYHIAIRIKQALGHLHIRKITQKHVGEFIRRLKTSKAKRTNKTLAPITVRKHQDILKLIFTKAVEWGDATNNPVEKLPRVKVPKKDKEIPNDAEMSALFKTLEKEPLWRQSMFNVLVNTGIRRGELIALQWKDVDFENKQIRISATLVKEANSGTVRKEPKTESGKRTIKISDECCDLLKKLQQEAKNLKPVISKQSNYNENIFKYVFFNPETCSPYHPDTISHLLPKLCKKASIKEFSPHCIRHWLCSGLLDDRIPIKHVQQLMGHSDSATTLNIYTHIVKDSMVNTADAVSAKISKLKASE